MGSAAAYAFGAKLTYLLLFEIWYIDNYITDIPFWLFTYAKKLVKLLLSKQEVKVLQSAISRATLGRLPAYLHFLESVTSEHISATAVAKALGLGEVLVRKDLSLVCGKGKPKTGYVTDSLRASLKAAQQDIALTDSALQAVTAQMQAETRIYERNMLGVKKDSLQVRYEALIGEVRIIRKRMEESPQNRE